MDQFAAASWLLVFVQRRASFGLGDVRRQRETGGRQAALSNSAVVVVVVNVIGVDKLLWLLCVARVAEC